MNLDLSGKTALITGGNVGIGAGIATTLAECGTNIAITYFSHKQEAEVTRSRLQDLNVHTEMYYLDATDSTQVDDVINQVASQFEGHIDFLVNNAGHLVDRVQIQSMTDSHWHHVLDVNVSSAFYCTRRTLAHMPDGGRIINMSSLAARNGGGDGAVAYAAAKAAIIGYTRGLAKELAPRNITVNALAPGFIVDTPFHDTFTGKEKYEDVIAEIPLGRAGLPRDVANAVLYYASDLGSWVTGQVAEINGGVWFV